jgi:hypothetical protein
VEAQGRTFGVLYNGSKIYPSYQFDGAGLPLLIIQQLLAALGFRKRPADPPMNL